MSEQIFFEHDGVRVSSARFVVKGTTYPISAITSVRAVRSKTFPLLAIVLILIGFGILLGGEPTLLIFGLATIALGGCVDNKEKRTLFCCATNIVR